MTVSRRLRFEILRRDGYTCRYCGARTPDATLTIDHVVPVTLGDDDDPRNLVTACTDCNAGKSSIAPDAALVADVDATALLFARAVQRAADTRRAQLRDEDALVREFIAEWMDWFPAYMGDDNLPGNAEASVIAWLTRGLDMADLKRFVAVTGRSRVHRRDAFRYFAGCCWREIGTREEVARQLLEDGDV